MRLAARGLLNPKFGFVLEIVILLYGPIKQAARVFSQFYWRRITWFLPFEPLKLTGKPE